MADRDPCAARCWRSLYLSCCRRTAYIHLSSRPRLVGSRRTSGRRDGIAPGWPPDRWTRLALGLLHQCANRVAWCPPGTARPAREASPWCGPPGYKRRNNRHHRACCPDLRLDSVASCRHRRSPDAHSLCARACLASSLRCYRETCR